MIKYVVEYVFFERARVWMYLLCDEVALLFFFGYHNAESSVQLESSFSLDMILLFFLIFILNPNF